MFEFTIPGSEYTSNIAQRCIRKHEWLFLQSSSDDSVYLRNHLNVITMRHQVKHNNSGLIAQSCIEFRNQLQKLIRTLLSGMINVCYTRCGRKVMRLIFYLKHQCFIPFKIVPLGSYTPMEVLSLSVAALEVFNRYGLQNVNYNRKKQVFWCSWQNRQWARFL